MTDAASGPLVAIVTPVYNGAQFLAETMECVQAQTYPNIIHYVLDNASTDATPGIIRHFEGRRIPLFTARNTMTIPMLDNWNAAVRLVDRKASYFRILPADDLIAPRGIEKMVAVGERHPEVGIIGCQESVNGMVLGADLPADRTVFDGRRIVRGSLLNVLHGFPHLHCLYRIPSDGLPRTFYETEFYGTPLLAIDLDAAMRALAEGYYGYVHEPLVTTRLHARSVTATEVSPGYLKLWSELQLIDRWGPKVFDCHCDYLKCRARHLRYYYRHLLLWRWQNNRRLFEQHWDWLTRASAEPTTRNYIRAALEWPFTHTLRRSKQIAAKHHLFSFYREVL